ncbi:MAG TPA: hypothetical protein VGN54_00970 [Mycobacteriales bacterium]|nr:hypothetical protein [Mycobacteriales bacterium]
MTTVRSARPLRAPLGEGPLFAEVGQELRWNLRGRPGWLAGIGFNFVLAAAYLGYYRSTAHFPDHGLAYIGASLSAWVLADPITTNQFGGEGERVAAAITGEVGIGRILLVKNLGLGLLLLMITLPVSLVATAWVGQWRQLHDAVLIDLHVLLVWLGLGNIVSVLLPYRPIPFAERWRLRRTWLRWGSCLLIPYALYAVIGLLSIPVRAFAHGGRLHHPAQYALLSLAWGIGYWLVATLAARSLALRRPARLLRDLHRPN